MSKPLPPVLSEDDDPELYRRLREETLHRFGRRDDPDRRKQDPGPEPRDRYWTLRRGWTGEEYFTPGKPPVELLGDGKVEREYDPLRGLKRD
jgi:hypothetical protein